MEIEVTPMQRLAYDAIEEIINLKRGNIEPCMAHITEIRNSINTEILEALRELYRRGVLSVSIDLNKNPMFSIKNPL